MSEIDYITGEKAAWLRMLTVCIKNLDMNNINSVDKKYILLLKERNDAIIALRSICNILNDNEWDDNLYLADIIEKYILKNVC